MSGPDYARLLESPQWEEKRYDVLQSCGWKCAKCGGAAVTAHHRRYKPGRKPWEYKNSEFEALCRLCHMGKHLDKVPAEEIEREEERVRYYAEKRRRQDW